ncbi:hypothetical protein PR003_g13296 [Phytophthora rubi]|uniref:Uncharacterized protein n=1 Tax=Phytophthora rubi TaxID=129364 RepID=A0A6A4EXR2_9STRA|nr:hypothetical protein PR002_g12863 [Phytophthora rubi]KAE9024856.1 hypothetical protein PR001_g12562 [Phytophthora rubi]KAE9334879.1 hypothetical protein PR003_g13296 [Phytophthora rubi]
MRGANAYQRAATAHFVAFGSGGAASAVPSERAD